MKCPNCGKEIADDSMFCEFCGTKLKDDVTPEKQEYKPQLKRNYSLWITLVVLLCAIISGFVYYEYNAKQAAIAEANQRAEEARVAKVNAEKEAQRVAEEARIAKMAADAEKKRLVDARKKEEEARQRKASLRTQGWIDLGLPSGTLWKAENEDCGLITYDQAYNFYGNSLPTKEQLEELRDNCLWTWQDNGYRVKGTSGESIFLPLAGSRNCWGCVTSTCAAYWSSTPKGESIAWCLLFYSGKVDVLESNRCDGSSVRLVK